MINSQFRTLQRHPVARCAAAGRTTRIKNHRPAPTAAQSGGNRRTGNATTDDRDLPGRMRQVRHRAAGTDAGDHLALAAKARAACDRKPCRRKTAPDMAGGGKAGKRPAGVGEPADMVKDVRCPHIRISGWRKSVEKPGISLKVQLRQQHANLAIMQMQRQPAIAKRYQMIARPARRQGPPQRRRRVGQFRKGRMRGLHLIIRQRQALNRHIVNLHVGMTLKKRHDGKTVEAGAKARFGNCQMITGGEPRPQIIAVKKDMPRLGQPLGTAIISIREIVGMGDAVAKADSGHRQLVNGTAMWRGWRHSGFR